VNRSVRWAYSPLDCQVHLLVPAGDHSWGVLTARCGHLLPAGAHQHEQPPWSRRRTCPLCAVISRRHASVPRDLWAMPPWGTLGPHSVSLPPGRRTTAQVMWARCPVDERLHLLSTRAVLAVAAGSSAVAWCGALLIAQVQVQDGSGTPCPEYLAAGSA
jgi:hypothetical protein